MKIFELYDDSDGTNKCKFVKIYVSVDNRRIELIDLLKIWEKPFAVPPNEPGDYSWIPVHFLYEDLILEPRIHPPYRRLLRCSCRNECCWPFLVMVEEQEKKIVWKNYLQPYRDRDSPAGFWDYSIYPELSFDKDQYYSELMPMKEYYDKWVYDLEIRNKKSGCCCDCSRL